MSYYQELNKSKEHNIKIQAVKNALKTLNFKGNEYLISNAENRFKNKNDIENSTITQCEENNDNNNNYYIKNFNNSQVHFCNLKDYYLINNPKYNDIFINDFFSKLNKDESKEKENARLVLDKVHLNNEKSGLPLNYYDFSEYKITKNPLFNLMFNTYCRHVENKQQTPETKSAINRSLSKKSTKTLKKNLSKKSFENKLNEMKKYDEEQNLYILFTIFKYFSRENQYIESGESSSCCEITKQGFLSFAKFFKINELLNCSFVDLGEYFKSFLIKKVEFLGRLGSVGSYHDNNNNYSSLKSVPHLNIHSMCFEDFIEVIVGIAFLKYSKYNNLNSHCNVYNDNFKKIIEKKQQKIEEDIENNKEIEKLKELKDIKQLLRKNTMSSSKGLTTKNKSSTSVNKNIRKKSSNFFNKKMDERIEEIKEKERRKSLLEEEEHQKQFLQGQNQEENAFNNMHSNNTLYNHTNITNNNNLNYYNNSVFSHSSIGTPGFSFSFTLKNMSFNINKIFSISQYDKNHVKKIMKILMDKQIKPNNFHFLEGEMINEHSKIIDIIKKINNEIFINNNNNNDNKNNKIKFIENIEDIKISENQGLECNENEGSSFDDESVGWKRLEKERINEEKNNQRNFVVFVSLVESILEKIYDCYAVIDTNKQPNEKILSFSNFLRLCLDFNIQKSLHLTKKDLSVIFSVFIKNQDFFILNNLKHSFKISNKKREFIYILLIMSYISPVFNNKDHVNANKMNKTNDNSKFF